MMESTLTQCGSGALPPLAVFFALVVSGCGCSDTPVVGGDPVRRDGGNEQSDSGNGGDGGGCEPNCVVDVTTDAVSDWVPGPADADFSGVKQEGDPDNPWLTLDVIEDTTVLAESVWVSNTNEGTVSRLDTSTGKEVARYVSAIPDATNKAWPWNTTCTTSFLPNPAVEQGNCPSRTAVDQNFDAYVANRAFSYQSTVTKFANKIEDCVDRNNNQSIETSSDKDQDGVINIDQNVPDEMREFYGVEDECILWTVPVGDMDGVARAIAVGKPSAGTGRVGDLWVGMNRSGEMIRLDAQTGQTLAKVDTGDLNPYGAVADMEGRIWYVNTGYRTEGIDLIGYVDPETLTNHVAPQWEGANSDCIIPYGMVVDAQGLVWVANAGCLPSVFYYDPVNSSWGGVDVPLIRRIGEVGDEVGTTCPVMTDNNQDYAVCSDGGMPETATDTRPMVRGLGASFKSIWLAVPCGTTGSMPGELLVACVNNPHSLLGQVDIATKTFKNFFPLGETTGPVGVGYSPNRKVWTVGQGSSSVAIGDLDADDNLQGSFVDQPVGEQPYTYSDFIGFGTNVLAAPGGFYRLIIDGCDDGFVTTWESLIFDAEEPPGTSIRFSVRAADTKQGLKTVPWMGPHGGDSPLALEDPLGPIGNEQFLQVEVLLETTDLNVRPRMRDFKVKYTCTPPTLK